MGVIGWLKSNLSGERHAFDVDFPADGRFRPNSSGGYRALCGVVARKLERPQVGSAAFHDFMNLPRCEACESLEPIDEEARRRRDADVRRWKDAGGSP
jgi:hypothetical protein